MVHIIIIGAGASGLAAAARLCEKGLDPSQLTILEAHDRIGGRIHTLQHGISRSFSFTEISMPVSCTF